MGYGVVSAHLVREDKTFQEPYLESAGERVARKTQTEFAQTNKVKTFEFEKIRQLDLKAQPN